MISRFCQGPESALGLRVPPDPLLDAENSHQVAVEVFTGFFQLFALKSREKLREFVLVVIHPLRIEDRQAGR
ncbi:MAG TPA: hypothetical protein VLV83_19525, partial [Acidobacteriota bacterium]|nr:hypothetical protein [Acidobacteriota bacterium]